MIEIRKLSKSRGCAPGDLREVGAVNALCGAGEEATLNAARAGQPLERLRPVGAAARAFSGHQLTSLSNSAVTLERFNRGERIARIDLFNKKRVREV